MNSYKPGQATKEIKRMKMVTAVVIGKLKQFVCFVLPADRNIL